MKVRDCTKCRKLIAKEEEEKFLKNQYVLYKDMSYTFAVLSTAAVLGVMYRRGRSKRYVRKLFKDICLMYDFPEVMGKRLDLDDVIETLESEYSIDFSQIKLHQETERQFITSAKKRRN